MRVMLFEKNEHGFIKDSEYYNWLVDNSERIKTRDYNALEQMIAVSCNIKRKVVAFFVLPFS